jgi:Flp pilus assembly secretin CpaC
MVSAVLITLLALLQISVSQHAPVISAEAAIASEAEPETVKLAPNETAAIEMPKDIRQILIADPEIVKVVLRSIRRVYLVGNTIGKTSVYFYDNDGNQIGAIAVWVADDAWRLAHLKTMRGIIRETRHLARLIRVMP